jgi:pimeloyl-ACP methyl ester carboxylesterase
MAARIPKAQRVVLPAAGHIVNIEAQAAFDRAISGFLQGLAG